ncbi:transcription antitermination factor NusB [Halalkalibacillus sediminis]|uniref:Transcription antitermination protein NusB n=1 Tax=Halalkalibacillus sediminis TaxID=2018042 RepID=A0A2I0QXB2_9BACI|nr:transcription antitermination factor NusB [Halalkalibacillus sediminis]PKR78954.1 transcription antitermination factor NusB [Halalkalibacillus sediminis]
MNRKLAREKAFQALYQIDINKDVSTEQILESLEDNQDDLRKELIEGVIRERDDLDQQISDKLEKWSFSRIGTVEKTVLRIAVYEIFHVEQTPNKVAVNEAIEIAKKYNDDQSGKFINGILSKFMTE